MLEIGFRHHSGDSRIYRGISWATFRVLIFIDVGRISRPPLESLWEQVGHMSVNCDGTSGVRMRELFLGGFVVQSDLLWGAACAEHM